MNVIVIYILFDKHVRRTTTISTTMPARSNIKREKKLNQMKSQTKNDFHSLSATGSVVTWNCYVAFGASIVLPLLDTREIWEECTWSRAPRQDEEGIVWATQSHFVLFSNRKYSAAIFATGFLFYGNCKRCTDDKSFSFLSLSSSSRLFPFAADGAAAAATANVCNRWMTHRSRERKRREAAWTSK